MRWTDAVEVGRLQTPAILMLALVAATPASAAAPASPPSCAMDPLYRQLDFTLGTWDVYANGKKDARVTMERALGGCAIHERWVSISGKPRSGNGLGLFTYSRLESRWLYLWAADTASATSFLGTEQSKDRVLFVTERPLVGGGVRLRHWTLSREPDGTVRELSVGTEDQGRTWTTEYDLRWRRSSK